MENKIENKITKQNTFKLENRNFLSISGVSRVNSFSTNSINLTALDCDVEIVGENLQTTKLDESTGIVEIIGLICSIKWKDKKEKISLVKRIFK